MEEEITESIMPFLLREIYTLYPGQKLESSLLFGGFSSFRRLPTIWCQAE
jgi:hypothetical protein